MLRRSFRRFAALTAVFALSLQAFWPLLVQAQPGRMTLLVPLCGAQGGSHTLDITTGKSTVPGVHCKLCLLGDVKDAAPLAPEPSPFVVDCNSEVHSIAPAASLPNATPRSARPRAPPAS